jgi:hypothetical protein
MAKAFAKQGERRRAARSHHATQAWISSPTATDASDRIAVGSVNLSRHGVAFHSTLPLAIGAYFRLQMTTGTGTSTTEVRIIHCKNCNDGFDIGSEFT